MKLRLLLLLTVAIFLFIPSSCQEEQGTKLNGQEIAGESNDKTAVYDSQKEENPTEDGEPTKKVRMRNGVKRRRRMRKRLRTTTEPPLEEQNENLNVAEQNAEVAYDQLKSNDEGSTALPPLEETTRRRQTKRRRRPHRKYQDVPQENQDAEIGENQTPKPPRRRRKGGRRRMRPQVETTEPNKIELYIETTVAPLEPSELTTLPYFVENESINQPQPEEQETPEQNNVPYYQIYDRRNLGSQPTVDLVEGSNEPPKFPENSRPQVVEEAIELHTNQPFRLKPYSIKPTVNTIKPVVEFVDETDENGHYESEEKHIEKETNEVPSQPPTEINVNQEEYGNKIFDRKHLFSKSRTLPETSAVIRKKLVPKQQIIPSENVTSRLITNLGKSRDTNSPNGVTQRQLIPEGYTVQPLTVEPSKLIEKLKAHAKSYRTITTTTTTSTSTLVPITTTEEPNYPKFESKKEKFGQTEINIIKTTTELVSKERFNKVVELHRSRGKVVISSDDIRNRSRQDSVPAQTITNQVVGATEASVPVKAEEDVVTTEQQPTILPENLNLEILNLNKLNDSIVELLKTESGNMKLSEILGSRNMTLAQLLEHRERGSSQFHLADIFAERKSLIGENTTAIENFFEKEEVGTPLYVEKQTILFPSQDVLGSFPAFISDKIEGAQKSKESARDSKTTAKTIVQLENREPRVFDSMPEFKEEKKDNRPPWRVPNPKLRPVSIRGDFEEIQLSLRPLENPKSGNEVDNVLLLDDKAEVLRTNGVSSTLEADSAKSQESGFSRFRRIPVTVKSAIIASVAILVLAIFGFLSVLISCRLRQKKARLRAKQDILCEHLKNEDFMNSQQSLSPVLTKQQQRGQVFTTHNTIHSNESSNRQYYLWRTLRKTFQYD